MSDGAKYSDIDDFGNIENVIKKFDPAFNDVTKRLPATVANFGQQQMSIALSGGEEAFDPEDAKMRLYSWMKGRNNG
jgi:hypothetical protein